jgi:hypothetical protein
MVSRREKKEQMTSLFSGLYCLASAWHFYSHSFVLPEQASWHALEVEALAR